MFFITGNDTIDHYPLPYEGRLKKLLCISKEIFKELKGALKESGIRPGRKTASRGKKASLPKFNANRQNKENPGAEHSLRGSTTNDRASRRDKYTPLYEPTNMVYTRDSSLWRWQHMAAWFKEQALYEDGDYQYREIIPRDKEI